MYMPTNLLTLFLDPSNPLSRRYRRREGGLTSGGKVAGAWSWLLTSM